MADVLSLIGQLECASTATPILRELPVVIDEARGAYLHTADGARLTDLTGGQGTGFVGFSNDVVLRALMDQARRMVHVGWLSATSSRAALLERLAARVPLPDVRFLLAGSGSEAVEAALKAARLSTGRYGVLAFSGAFHGKTAGCLEVTAGPALRAGVVSGRGPSLRLPYPEDPAVEQDGLASVERAVSWLEALLEQPDFPSSEIGALLVEPVQGSRMNAPPPGFLAALRVLADRHGLLLIADEVYSGVGRTGTMLAFEADGVLPDMVVLGKALGAGLPLSVVAGPAALMDSLDPYKASSTYLGSPLACAVGAAVLDHLDDIGSPQIVARLRDEVERAVAHVSPVLEQRSGQRLVVTGRGLMIGLRCVGPDPQRARATAVQVRDQAARDGFITGIAGPTLKLSPNLALSLADVSRFAESMESAVSRTSDDGLVRA